MLKVGLFQSLSVKMLLLPPLCGRPWYMYNRDLRQGLSKIRLSSYFFEMGRWSKSKVYKNQNRSLNI